MDRPSILQIYERVDQDLGPKLKHSSKSIFAKAISACSHLLHAYAEEKSKNLHPLRATGEVLNEWASIFLEKGRKEPSKAKGVIQVRSTSELTLPKGTVFRFGDIEFLTDKDELIQAEQEIPVTARVAQQIQLIPKGMVLITDTIPGLETSAKVVSMGRGSNQESDESLKERVLERVRNPPQGGSPQDYIVWAKEVPGVTRAWVAPRFHGLGNVALAFVCDDNGGVSTEQVKTALENKMKEVAPAAANFIPYSLEAEPIHFIIKADPVSIKPQVELELANLIKKVSEPVLLGENCFINSRRRKTTGVLPVSEIHEVLALIPKRSYKLVYPLQDIQVSEGKIFTFGGVNVLPI